ncbi:SDR family NAD(P)-dependent oxidoreductase [Deinococcus sp.]|uniref:SDR family NAD(P)-dependent oxidoreductase n=1 Tax=Deinococcus sp. TaxID=47478 RepID=UPI003CC6BD68
MTLALERKKVIVTGGSRGIGRATVLRLAAMGAHVLFSYRSDEDAARAVEAEVREMGGQALGVQADLSVLADLQRLFAVIPERFGGRPDAYIGNAFPAAVFMPTAIMTENGYDGLFAAVRGHYFALQQAALSVNDGGSSIVLSSGAAAQPQPASGAYAGAKAAVERFALSLASWGTAASR